MKQIKILIIVIVATAYATAQIPVLDEYITVGLENNLALKQQEFSLQKSIAALREARGMFLPSISIEARYSRAGGGRIIEMPVGDLVNPVYHTIIDILQGLGQPTIPWVDIPNEYIPFLREEEHDTKLRIAQPVIQPAIFYNYKIKKRLKEIEDASRLVFARQLISDIKTAYFNYLKTVQIVQLLDTTRDLLEENIRVNESLLRNDKVTVAAVHRARADLYELEQQTAEAEKNREMAVSYFNLLLNRPLDESIIITPVKPMADTGIDTDEASNTALANREEIVQLSKAVAIARHQVGLNRSSHLPALTAVFDLGYQGDEYRFNDEDDYWMASAVMSWNLFDGLQTRNKVQQAKLDRKHREAGLEELKNRIRLQTRVSVHNLAVAEKSIIAADQGLISARKTYEIIDRKYREGMSPQIEYIDARNTMTRAEINRIVVLYDYHIRQAELEKVLAPSPLNDSD